MHQLNKPYRLIYYYILVITNLVFLPCKLCFANNTKTELYQGLHRGLHIYRYNWINE
ncbi:uncharacterized protein METZ01_LOCUS180614, partial [marine metagenome]